MKGKKLVLLIPVVLTLLLVSLVVFPGCEAGEPEVFELKIQSAWPHGDLSMETLTVFADSAYERSDGRLVITVFGEPDIVPMFDVLEATKVGTLDMGHAGGTLWGGIIPVAEVEFGIPYGYNVPGNPTFEEANESIRSLFFDTGFIDVLRDEYAKQGVYYLDIHTYGPVPITVATKPLVTLADLQGEKIRDEGLWTEWHNMLGMAGTDISGSDAYMALKLGTLDAAQWDTSCITGLHWNEVAPYWIRGFESDACIGHILVNMDVWNSLPDDLKEALAGAAEDYWYATVDAYGADLQAVEDMVASGALTEVWLNDATLAECAATAHTIWDEVAARDAACADAIQLIKEWQGLD
jgi:TRAP-type mannitol/chloroaromatic compound transport system substrate-binding protein